MPYRDQQQVESFVNDYSGPPQDPPQPTMAQTWDAAFRMDNDVANALSLMTGTEFPRDDNFKPAEWLKKHNLWEYRDNFVDARSEAQANFIAARIRQEQEDNATLQRAGWAGTTARIAAGLLSPTLVMPFTAEGRGLQAFGKAALLGLGAGTLQEVPLQLNQQTRPLSESVSNIAMMTVLGGILGGAVAHIGAEELRGAADAMSADMAAKPGSGAIPQALNSASSRAEEAGKFKPALGAITLFKKMSPVMRTIEGSSATARWMMAQLSDAGLAMEKNALERGGIPTTPLGTAENLTKTWYSRFARAVGAFDENYLSFVYDGNVPGFAPGIRAMARGSLGGGEKSKASFGEAVSRAMREGDKSANPYVEATAKAIRKEVYDPLLKEAQALGVIPKELDTVGDVSYLFRRYNRKAIVANFKKFIDTLAAHYEGKLTQDFTKSVDNFKTASAKDEELITAMKLTPEEVEEQRAFLREEKAQLEEGANTEHLNALEDTIANLRGLARQLKDAGQISERNQMLADAREMERSAGQPLLDLRLKKAEVNRRLRNLNKAQFALEERLARKVEKIERTDELSYSTLRRAAVKAQKLLNQLDGLSDEKFDKLVSELKTQFARTAELYDKGEEKIAATTEDAKLLGLDAVQRQRADRLNEIVAQLEEAESKGSREEVRALVEDGLQETLARAQGIVERRAIRQDRLRRAVENAPQQSLEERIAAVKAARAERVRATEERFRERGANYVDLSKGKVDFAETARDAAMRVAEKIRAVDLRLPAFEVMQAERGAELARVLDIPSSAIEEFLVNDPLDLVRSYIRTVAPDVEMARKFGTVNAQEQFDELKKEESERLYNLRADYLLASKDEKLQSLGERAKKILSEPGKLRRLKELPKELEELGKMEIPDKELVKKALAVADEYAGYRRDLSAVIGRIRHTWGLPTDPDSIAFRAGKIALNLNVLRFMGGVTVSSIPDVARPIMRYGVLRAFRSGFIPLITNFKTLKLGAKQVRLLGGGLDFLNHARAQALFDTFDELGRGSKFERGLDYATNRMGLIAGFDYWTSAMKQFTGVITMTRALDAVQTVVEGGSKKELESAVEFLASNGINGERARDIWQEVQNGGGVKQHGIWLPNTEDWKNPDNVRAFQSMLIREVDNAIVTPGVERPLFVDQSMTGRLVSQFKSFTLSSTSKMALAGLQQRDMAALSGALTSLAFGALSYYIYAMAAGGETKERMLNATPEKWADEAINRSGLLAVLSLPQEALERIPATSGLVTLSGQRTTRRGGDDLIDTLFGPTFDLASKGSKVLNEIDDPTQSTLRTLKQMMPFGNLIYLRAALDKVVKSSGLPETRQ